MDIYDIDSYNYNLPENQIAQTPIRPQHDCKLLHCKINDGKMIIEDKIFKDIINILNVNDIIYFNNSKVVPSRIYIGSQKSISDCSIIGRDGSTKHIKDGEIFWLRKISDNIHEFLVRPGSKLKTGTKIYIGKYELEIVGNTSEGREVKISPNVDIYSFLEIFGNMPLPPYIGYEKNKDPNYQPIFAKTPGSVASPTASLHFTNFVIDGLMQKGICQEFVTLHVGMGTFKSVDVSNINDYQIHGETAEIEIDIFEKIYQQKIDGKKILSIGTTSARTLESLPYLYMHINNNLTLSIKAKIWRDNLTQNLTQSEYITNIYIKENITFETKIYIYAGYIRRIVDKLITNFHLPKSSLMMLVASKMGFDNMNEAYRHAIDNNYRFYSFGDAMYIDINS